MIKNHRYTKMTAKLTAVFMLCSLLTPGAFANVKAEAAAKAFDLIEITDYHGALEDSSTPALPTGGVIAKDIKDIIKANPDRTLVMSAGDLYQGTPMSNVLFGVPVQKLMSSLGLEVTTIGNHEFDWGLDKIINTTMKDAKYSVVCSNLYDKAKDTRVFDPYKIITKDGVKIAVIGAITTETPGIVLPANIANYKITDPATEINSLAKEIKDNKKADVVLALMHEGSNQDCKTGPVFEIADKLSNVDAVFGGHSHTVVQAKSKSGIPVVIGKAQGKGFIDLKMSVDTSGKVSFDNTESSFVAIDNNNPNGYKAAKPNTDADAMKIVADAKTEVGPTFNEKIGSTKTTLTRAQSSNPFGESYLGNWTTDVMKAKGQADVAFQNNGGIRIDIPAGDITVGTIYTFMPFDNVIVTVSMNKAQLTKVFEQAVADKGKGIQASGVKVTYDMTKPSGSRVTSIIRKDGKAIGDDEIIKVATNDFLAQGGDGFPVFTEPAVKSTYNDTHILVRDALIENVRTNKGINTVMDSRLVGNGEATISILGTSDLHGSIYPIDYGTGKPASLGLAKVSTYVNSIRSANPNVVLVDAGDTIQGTPLSYYYDKIDTAAEYPMMKVMGAMKYDTWTLGNHEYNYGLTVLNRVIKDAGTENINVLSANTYKTSDESNFVKPYIVKTFKINGKDVKVGILGLTTKTIPSWENASNYEGLKFNDLVDEAKKWVPVLREKEKVDILVATIHSGEETPNDTIPENQVKAVAAGVDGIDAILCGHAHSNISSDVSVKNPSGKVVTITEPGKNGQLVSQIDIKVKANGTIGAVTSKTVKMDDKVEADQAILKLAQPYEDATIKYINTVIGKSEGEFPGTYQTTQPTALMDLINKVQMDGAKTQLSIAAPLSASAYIPQGDITIQSMMGVYVFENFLYGVKMTGAQLKNWMEFSVRYYKQASNPSDQVVKDSKLNIPDYNLDQLYGATYDIDLTQPACTVDAKTGEVISGNRIKNLKVNGVPVKDTDLFTVAINNYRYNGGGGFMKAAGLKSGDPSITTYDSAKTLGDDGQVRNMMIKYIQDKKTITPDVANNWKISTSAIVPFSVKSIKGQDRYETAVNISKSGWEKGSDYVVVANGETAADALCAAPLAKKYNAPLLLTTTNELSEAAKAELQRLNAKHIIIIGGEAVVSKTVENTLKKTASDVTRIYGTDRFETSAKIAKEIGSKDGAVVVNGYSDADEVSVSAIAAAKGMPILLTSSSKLPESVKQYLVNNKPANSYIVGLESTVSKEVKADVDSSVSTSSVRLGGNNRFETNLAILKQFEKEMKFEKTYFVSSDVTSDAAAGAALASEGNSPIVLTNKAIPDTSVNFLKDKLTTNSTVILLGEQAVVPAGF